MTVNPLNVLKRKLEDENTPITKRLCLAKNVVKSSNFPSLPKEKIVGEWLASIYHTNAISKEDYQNVLQWVKEIDELTVEMKLKLIQITSAYIQKNPLEVEDVPSVLQFLENDKLSPQFHTLMADYIFISKSALSQLKESEVKTAKSMINKIFSRLQQFYRDSRKKSELIEKILEIDTLKILFSFLDIAECKNFVKQVLQNILFPQSKKIFYASLLKTMMQNDNVDALIAEKGDNIRSILKVVNTLLTPTDESNSDFIEKFLEVIVMSFKHDSQLIFVFYIIIGTALDYNQSYIKPAMHIQTITFDDKTKRNIFRRMLEVLIENEIDINVRLTDILASTAPKAELKKSFTLYLQTVMHSILKLEGKSDKATMQIVKTALKLDPSLIEPKLDIILPPLMTVKKATTVGESYKNMLNYLLETLFKLSRGTIFLAKILPNLKSFLEGSNTEQTKLQDLVNKSLSDGMDCEKQQNKIITLNDVFPQECIELYGKLTSELMFRQNCELLTSLQKDMEEFCLKHLEDGDLEPSTIIMTELLAAILSSFFERNKMADHTVPLAIAEEFWSIFAAFERDVLKKFGKCLPNHGYNARLTTAFLKLCSSYASLKILNLQYSSQKLQPVNDKSTEVFDLSALLNCLNSKKWIALCSSVSDIEAVACLDKLLSLKLAASELNGDENDCEITDHLINEASNNPTLLTNNCEILNILLRNLNQTQAKQIAKILVNELSLNTESKVSITEAISSNKMLLNSITMETLIKTTKLVENTKNLPSTLVKAMQKSKFSIQKFLEDVTNVPEYFENFASIENDRDVVNCLSLLSNFNICYVEENIQLTAIFIALAIKHKAESKKIQKAVDSLLLKIFEITPKYPDMFKLFPIDYMFDFDKETFLNLLTLNIKTSNQFLPIKCLLESAVKKVKTNDEVIKITVKILLTHQKVKKEDTRNMDYFSDKVFLISCMILPIIAKEKRAITTSNYRSILAELQEKLHKSLLKSFKSINFENERSVLLQDAGNTDANLVVSESMVATLNAMEAFSLTLSKYCESTDSEEIKNLDCLWNGLEYFVQNAILSIKTSETKNQHVDSSVQLLNVVLRYIKKLETHKILQNKDQLFTNIWSSVKSRLFLIFGGKINKKSSSYVSDACLDELAVTLKFISELSSVESFQRNFVGDLFALMVPKKQILKEEDNTIMTSHLVAKYVWSSFLKANIIGPKCIALSKIIYRTCKNLSLWIRQHYEISTYNGRKLESGRNEDGRFLLKVEESVCDMLKVDLEIVSDVTLAAKKIPLDYKFMDAIFELQHMIHFIINRSTLAARCEIPWRCYFALFEGALSVLNSLALSRDELLEDRWPNYMQCYRALVGSLCEKSSTQDELERVTEDKLAEIAHCIEKLTQCLSKKKTHISRLAAYTIGDICSDVEKMAPARTVRQHLENSVALFIQSTDSNYSMAFLRRALAGHPGQLTMTNLYTMYKRYHKYVGNS